MSEGAKSRANNSTIMLAYLDLLCL